MSAMFTPNFNAFRFYDDDGGEAASTQLAAQDTNHSINADSDVAFQLRVRVDEVGGVAGTSMDDFSILYSKNSGIFIQVPTTDSGDGIRAVAAGLTNDNATTDRSTSPISNPGGGSFVAGEQSDDGIVDDHTLTASDFTEHAYGIEFLTANVADADTFDFEIGGKISNNNVVPRMTIVKSGGAQTISGTVGEISTGESVPSDAALAAATPQAITGTVGEIASAESFANDHIISNAVAGIFPYHVYKQFRRRWKQMRLTL